MRTLIILIVAVAFAAVIVGATYLFNGAIVFLATLGLFLFIAVNWATWFRIWLKNRPWPWSQRYFDWIEPIEIVLYKKSKTIFWARFTAVMTSVPALVSSLLIFNNPELIALLPDHWEKYAILFFVVLTVVSSIVQEVNRKNTDTALDVVALPTQIDKPSVAEAVAELDVAKENMQEALKETGLKKKTRVEKRAAKVQKRDEMAG